MDDGMTLEALRFLLVGKKTAISCSLRPYGERGMAIRFELRGGGVGSRTRGWLLSEKSKRVRVFSRAETAFGVLRSLGVLLFTVDLEPEAALYGFPRSSKNPAPRFVFDAKLGFMLADMPARTGAAGLSASSVSSVNAASCEGGDA